MRPDDPPDAAEGASLFGDPPGQPAGGGYLVLARKYRPNAFEDLIGQEAMVRTIANSFALGRIPHAYVLTGVRGVGKTTTARLIARALNYETASVKAPSLDLSTPGVHCAAISASQHPDVFEMDAASRTGINDIREILDSVRYAPVMARTKVYIIDEVHMLSTAAFNGLLKTLEEPPPHVKFIFATTEIRKVPVTVLSRCQRFDLKRIAPDTLIAHLQRICAKEAVAIETDALALIARAAEGSVRDSLSLLDQALVQKTETGAAISAGLVRDMLGLADRGRVTDLFSALVEANARAAILETRSQYDSGADPALILRDLLDVAHEVARVQALGAEAQILAGADQAARLHALAERLSPAQAGRLWQMILKAHEEVSRAPEPIQAAEMAMVRIAAAMGLPPPEDAARLLRGEGRGSSPPAPPADPPEGGSGPRLSSFEDVLALIAARREVALEIEVERFVRLARFEPGRIACALKPGAPSDLPMRLARALSLWTDQVWRVDADAESQAETVAERVARQRAEEEAALRAHPFVAEALQAFPGAEITSVRAPADQGAEVVALRTPQKSKSKPAKESRS